MSKAWVGSFALFVSLLCGACSEQFVERIVIDNPTEFDANVHVTEEERADWLVLTTAEANAEKTIDDVIDQGATWIFRFTYSGYSEEIEVSRAELARSGWRVEVPDSFASALRDGGVEPPP